MLHAVKGRKKDMTDKVQAMEAIRQMPDTASLEEILRQLAFMAGVRKGLEQLDHGSRVPLAEIEKKISPWAVK